MKLNLKIISISIFCLLFFSCKQKLEEKTTTSEPNLEWKILFNGEDLTGWDTYLGMPYKEGLNYGKQKEREDYNPFGLNNDPLSVFSVVEEDGEKVLRISGEVWGGI